MTILSGGRAPTNPPPIPMKPASALPLWGTFLEGFGFEADPFEVDYVTVRTDLLSGSARHTLSRLADEIGSSTAAKGLLLVGPEGSGKTLFLRSLAKRLSESDRARTFRYVDARAPPKGGRTSTQVRVRGRPVRSNLMSREVTLIDNADCIAAQVQEMPVTGSRVLGISTDTYSGLQQSGMISREWATHFLMPYQNDSEVETTLRGLVAHSAPSRQPFEDDAYQAISSSSMGLPGLAMDLASASLWVSGWVGATRVSKSIVEKASECLYYGVAKSLASGAIRLGRARANIVNEALRLFHMEGDIRRSDLASHFRGVPGSVLEHHLEKLADQRLLSKTHYGHRVHYDIPRPVRAAIQIL